MDKYKVYKELYKDKLDWCKAKNTPIESIYRIVDSMLVNISTGYIRRSNSIVCPDMNDISTWYTYYSILR